MPTSTTQFQLDNTLYGETANSYASVDFADFYFSKHINAATRSAWAALTEDNPESGQDQKSFLLIQACFDIEQFKYTARIEVPVYHWFFDPTVGRLLVMQPTLEPIKYNYFQALQFPRNIDYRSDGTIYIPERILWAQCEQAAYLMTFDQSVLALRSQGLIQNEIRVGGTGGVMVNQKFDREGTTLAPRALAFLKPYMRFQKRLVRS